MSNKTKGIMTDFMIASIKRSDEHKDGVKKLQEYILSLPPDESQKQLAAFNRGEQISPDGEAILDEALTAAFTKYGITM